MYLAELRGEKIYHSLTVSYVGKTSGSKQAIASGSKIGHLGKRSRAWDLSQGSQGLPFLNVSTEPQGRACMRGLTPES